MSFFSFGKRLSLAAIFILASFSSCSSPSMPSPPLPTVNHAAVFAQERSNWEAIAALHKLTQATLEALIASDNKALGELSLKAVSVSDQAIKYMSALWYELCNKSGGLYPEDGSIKSGRPKAYASSKEVKAMLIEGDMGQALYKNLLDCQQQLRYLAQDLSSRCGLDIGAEELEMLQKKLFILDDKSWRVEKASSWQAYQFAGLTLSQVAAELSKTQLNIELAIQHVLGFALEKVNSKLSLRYDKFDIFSQPTKSAVHIGEEFETAITLGAYSSQTKFSAKVEGKELPLVDGKAIWRKKAVSAGEQSYTVEIAIENPLTGESIKETRSFKYPVLAK